MDMMSLLKTFAGAFVVIAILDSLWLTLMRSFFERHVGHLMRDPFVLWPGIIVWTCIALGILIFVAPLSTSWTSALLYGAILGGILYGVYDFTNMAVLDNWPLIVSVVDVTWGCFLGAISSLVAYWVTLI